MRLSKTSSSVDDNKSAIEPTTSKQVAGNSIEKKAWSWIPSLYFAEGLPYVAVNTLSVILYKRLGLSNADIAFYTAWLYLPWTLKFLWSPIVEILKNKRWWIISMQLLIGACLGGVAFSIPGPFCIQASLAFFWLAAFSSATHDIAADGFYMHALSTVRQAFFIGIRNTFYRIAMIFTQGLLVMLAGWLENRAGNPFHLEQIPFAWAVTFMVMAVLFLLLGIHHLFALPKPNSDKKQSIPFRKIGKEFIEAFVSFFQKKGILTALAFMLFYRFSEAQLVKLSSPFLLDKQDVGGLGLSTTTVGFAYGTIGLIALILGGILGGISISKKGLKKCLWPMALAISIPNAVYIGFAFGQTENVLLIHAGIALEQFGYGYGFTAYTMYLLHFCQGKYQTAHYAICTAFMALGMMLPGMFAGKWQEAIGYPLFFCWIMLCTLATFAAVKLIHNKINE